MAEGFLQEALRAQSSLSPMRAITWSGSMTVVTCSRASAAADGCPVKSAHRNDLDPLAESLGMSDQPRREAYLAELARFSNQNDPEGSGAQIVSLRILADYLPILIISISSSSRLASIVSVRALRLTAVTLAGVTLSPGLQARMRAILVPAGSRVCR